MFSQCAARFFLAGQRHVKPQKQSKFSVCAFLSSDANVCIDTCQRPSIDVDVVRRGLLSVAGFSDVCVRSRLYPACDLVCFVMEQKARNSKEWKSQSGIVTFSLGESRWNRCHFSLKKWESEKHKSWGMLAEGFKGHVANRRLSSGCSWTVAGMRVSGATGF